MIVCFPSNPHHIKSLKEQFMAMSDRLFSSYRPLLVLVISLLLVNAYVVNAQNSNNTNTSNVNSAANNNTNVNANSNTNTNANQNTTDSKGGTDQNAKTTATPVDIRAKLLESNWYALVVSLLFGSLLIGFAATIIRVILRSRSSFRSPLGLPEGSLRAMLAFLLVAFLGFYVYASILSLSDFRLPESLLGIIATVIGFYFGSRSGEEKAAGATSGRTGSIEGTVVDNSGSPAAGATIDLSQGPNKKFMQTADLNGKFDFDNIPIGDYDIQALKTGHAPSDSVKVKVTAGGTQPVNLKLK
jgi:carboxypeptidase family protein/protein Pet20